MFGQRREHPLLCSQCLSRTFEEFFFKKQKLINLLTLNKKYYIILKNYSIILDYMGMRKRNNELAKIKRAAAKIKRDKKKQKRLAKAQTK